MSGEIKLKTMLTRILRPYVFLVPFATGLFVCNKGLDKLISDQIDHELAETHKELLRKYVDSDGDNVISLDEQRNFMKELLKGKYAKYIEDHSISPDKMPQEVFIPELDDIRKKRLLLQWYKSFSREQELRRARAAKNPTTRPQGKVRGGKTLEGRIFGWRDDGQKAWEADYVDGKLEGKHVGWFSNGRKAWQLDYAEGRLDGRVVRWHRNGKKEREANYSCGKPEGRHRGWYENGNRAWERYFAGGKPEGKQAFWDKKGRKVMELNYSGGRLEGRQIYWREDGTIAREEYYTDGRRVEQFKERVENRSSQSCARRVRGWGLW